MSQFSHISSETAEIQSRRPKKNSSSMALGQVVIVTARWILVFAGLLLALWNSESVGELRIQILVILLLAMSNFYLQSQLLMRRPPTSLVMYAASLADLIVITILINSNGGFQSGLYVFYFPAILAFAVAFPTDMTAFFVTSTIAIYTTVSLLMGVSDYSDLQVILTRVLMITAVAFCGNLYRRIEHRRLQSAIQAQTDLMSQIRQRQVATSV
ncbi:hypothetical protein MNBD_CHLOROFLEXI01-2234 [hydrothermal vent metagenome]|uniref:Uncharacterized protein n=1 Tax=hydrothermal vent metagenome TaxID=652676 RepID=A0A3B0UWS3_9ZZZZ